MATTKFNIPLLYEVVHDQGTKSILEGLNTGERSKFVRNAINKFARSKGFEQPCIESIENNKPDYVPEKKWRQVLRLQKNSRRVDYSYVIAYHWLKSLPEFSYQLKSAIVRAAIKSYSEKYQQDAD